MIRIELLHSPAPRQVHVLALDVSEGATIAEALAAAGWIILLEQAELGRLSVGVWGRRASLDTGLRDGDRVELYRPLRVDPKVARRERFVDQGAKVPGLFARRRPHSKAGY